MKTNFTPFPILTTERLVLRQLVLSDKDELMRLRNDETVNRYLLRPKHTTAAEADQYIKMISTQIAENKSGYWVIALKANNVLMGTICIWNLDMEKEIADIGYELLPHFQGQGIMQEAVEKIITYSFDEMQVKAIIGMVDAENKRSVRLLEKNGFKRDTAHQYVIHDDAGNDVAYFLTSPNA